MVPLTLANWTTAWHPEGPRRRRSRESNDDKTWWRDMVEVLVVEGVRVCCSCCCFCKVVVVVVRVKFLCERANPRGFHDVIESEIEKGSHFSHVGNKGRTVLIMKKKLCIKCDKCRSVFRSISQSPRRANKRRTKAGGALSTCHIAS